MIVSNSLGQAWLINHPECRVKDAPHSVFFTQLADNPELTTASQKIFSDWSANYLGYDEIGTQSFMPSVLPGGQDMDELALLAIDSLFRDGPNRTIGTALLGETNSQPSHQHEMKGPQNGQCQRLNLAQASPPPSGTAAPPNGSRGQPRLPKWKRSTSPRRM